MSFNSKNEKNHLWSRFCCANNDLIISTGIPLAAVEHHDAFLYFVEHGYIYYLEDQVQHRRWDTDAAFTSSAFTAEQRKQFLLLAEALMTAGYEYEATAGLTCDEREKFAEKFPAASIQYKE